MKRRSKAGPHPVCGLFLAGVLCLAPGPAASWARAAVETYSIDPGHSGVGFSIAHFFSRVPGRFNRMKGTFSFDAEDLSTAAVRAVIDAGSIDTANADRDTHLRSADFFDVQNHRLIVFESSGVRPGADDTVMVDGTLTLRGVSRPVTLEVEFLGSGPDLWGHYRSGFVARTTIDRKDYGMIWNASLDGGGFMLGDEVSIQINIEGVRQDASDLEEPATDGETPEPPGDEAAPDGDEAPPAGEKTPAAEDGAPAGDETPSSGEEQSPEEGAPEPGAAESAQQ